jgi:probable F420-dependent oxidoreductase
VKIGIATFPTDYSINVVTLGRAMEQRGFESLFVCEHTHIPASRRTPYPGGGDLPEQYYHTLDPFVGLAAVASVTWKLVLGTGVCLVIERDPITLAKEVASLDLLSNGRFIFGVGAGWNEEEMQNHGTAPAQRFQLLRERILAMKEIWTKDEADFHGKLVNFDPIWSWPKPVQKPHPPVYIGGWGPHTMKRVIEYGDGYLPIVRPGIDDQISRLQQLAREAGRGPIPVTAFWAPADAAAIAALAKAGVDRCLLNLPSISESEAMPVLDRYAALIRELSGA